MKHMFIFLLVSVAFAGFILGKDKTAASTWTAVPIIIDAAGTEWTVGEPLLDEAAKIEVRFQNDGKNLYILFLFHDRQTMSSFAQTGLSIYFNTEGKRKKGQGLLFQGRQIPAVMMVAYLEQQRGTPLSDAEKAKIMGEKYHLVQQCSYLGKDHIPFIANHPASPRFASGMIGGKVGLEISIPFQYNEALPAGIATTGLEIGKPTAICFEWGGATKTMKGNMLMSQTNSREMSQQRSTSTYELTQGNEADGRRSADTGSAWDSAEGGMRRPVGPKVWTVWLQLNLAVGQ